MVERTELVAALGTVTSLRRQQAGHVDHLHDQATALAGNPDAARVEQEAQTGAELLGHLDRAEAYLRSAVQVHDYRARAVAEVTRLAAERDEVARLTAERDEALAEIVRLKASSAHPVPMPPVNPDD